MRRRPDDHIYARVCSRAARVPVCVEDSVVGGAAKTLAFFVMTRIGLDVIEGHDKASATRRSRSGLRIRRGVNFGGVERR